MPLQSDLMINTAKFHPNAISDRTKQVNECLMKQFDKGPKWYEVGASRYRKMRRNKETAFHPPKLLPEGFNIDVPSRQHGQIIPCRVIFPSARKTARSRKNCSGTFLHIHGGGWVLGDHLSADELMLKYANAADVAVISVGYRLAPEHAFPRGMEDCFDAAEHLLENSDDQYGGPLKFLGGESAGAHLSLLTACHLFGTHPDHRLHGLLLHFGCYDLTLTPSARRFTLPLLLNTALLNRFIDAYLSDTHTLSLLSKESTVSATSPSAILDDVRAHPSISPYYQAWDKYRDILPPALFTCGTADPLIDDSTMMATKWAIAGGKSILKIYPGAPHSFLNVHEAEGKEAAERDSVEFLEDCLAGI